MIWNLGKAVSLKLNYLHPVGSLSTLPVHGIGALKIILRGVMPPGNPSVRGKFTE